MRAEEGKSAVSSYSIVALGGSPADEPPAITIFSGAQVPSLAVLLVYALAYLHAIFALMILHCGVHVAMCVTSLTHKCTQAYMHARMNNATTRAIKSAVRLPGDARAACRSAQDAARKAFAVAGLGAPPRAGCRESLASCQPRAGACVPLPTLFHEACGVRKPSPLEIESYWCVIRVRMSLQA